MGASSFKSSAQYQRERRDLNRRRGVRRLDIEIDPKLMVRLQRELAGYGAYTHPGAALVEWLKMCYRNKVQQSRMIELATFAKCNNNQVG